MNIYQLSVHEKNLIFSSNHNNPVIYENKKLLTDMKCKIDKCDNKKWEDAKKRANAYEYIYTSSKMLNNICRINPVSRSYFKIHEMIKNHNLLEKNIYCACLAEGPGGFINCINQLSKYEKLELPKIYGITLISSDKKVPFWNNSILTNPMNHIINGEDGTGNIYRLKNVENFIKEINGNFCKLVTADGGFDYSEDYNSQEESSYELLYSEIYLAINIQKLSGNFVIKMFDLFTQKTIQLLYLLYNLYENISIYKPLTSRLSNSEKYVICSNFLGCPKKIKDKLKEYYDKKIELHIDIPETFIKDINEYNDNFTKLQMESINTILKNIESKNILKKPSDEQIKNAMDWCEKYGLPINQKCIYLK